MACCTITCSVQMGGEEILFAGHYIDVITLIPCLCSLVRMWTTSHHYLRDSPNPHTAYHIPCIKIGYNNRPVTQKYSGIKKLKLPNLQAEASSLVVSFRCQVFELSSS